MNCVSIKAQMQDLKRFLAEKGVYTATLALVKIYEPEARNSIGILYKENYKVKMSELKELIAEHQAQQQERYKGSIVSIVKIMSNNKL